MITGAGQGGGPHVQVFDGVTHQVVRSFYAYDPIFAGGVFVAAGDVNGDGFADIVTGIGEGGGPNAKVFSGKDGSVLMSFYAYDPVFAGGLRVAAGDVNGDGLADVITGIGTGGGPNVKVFNGRDGEWDGRLEAARNESRAHGHRGGASRGFDHGASRA